MTGLTDDGNDTPWYVRLLSFTIAAVLIGALLRFADLDAIRSALSLADFRWYFAGVGVFLLSYVAATYRWVAIERNLGYDIGFLTGLEVVSISYSANLLLPANAGDLTRGKLVEQYHEIDSQAEVLSSVAFVRVVDLVVLVGLFFVSSLYLGATLLSVDLRIAVLSIAITSIAVIVVVSGSLTGIRRFVPEIVLDQIAVSRSTLRGMTTRTVAYTVGLTVASWLLVAVSFVVLSRSLGAPVGFPIAAATVTGMAVAAVLPLTPGGFGVGDTVAVALLISAGLDHSTSVTLALLYRSFNVLWGGPLGISLYLHRFLLSRSLW